MKYPFKNLVFEGGGVKGIAYVGALEELQKRDIMGSITRIGGTSAGAINVVLLSLGYTLDETYQIMSILDFREFVDASKSWVLNVPRLLRQFGWCKGEFFRSWIEKLIAKKTGASNSTFEDLQRSERFKDLYLIGTNLSTRFAEVFSAEQTPSMSVAEAVRRSMSIPLFFAAVRDRSNDVFVDGGVFDNYPIKVFDRAYYLDPTGETKKHARETKYYATRNERTPDPSRRFVYNKETLGFRLCSGHEIEMFWEGAKPTHENVDGFFDYAVALVQALLNAQNNLHLHSDDWHRTIYVDTMGVKTTDFDLDDAKKRMLIDQGKKGVNRYFEWYDRFDPSDPPKNHPDYVD